MYLLFIVAASIKPNDIIWAKYSKYPYWPALVSYKGIIDIFNGHNVNVNIQTLQFLKCMFLESSHTLQSINDLMHYILM